MNHFCGHNVVLCSKVKKISVYTSLVSLVSDCVAFSGWSERAVFGSELMSRVNLTVKFALALVKSVVRLWSV